MDDRTPGPAASAALGVPDSLTGEFSDGRTGSRSRKPAPPGLLPPTIPGRPRSEDPWEKRLEDLLAFRRATGHCNVPRHWAPDRTLSYWVMNQRYQHRRGTLSPDRERRLRENGISWSPAQATKETRDRIWLRMFKLLKRRQERRGPGKALPRTAGGRKLAQWLCNQSSLLRRGRLQEDRRRKLVDLGLEPGMDRGRSRLRDAAWTLMMDRLRVYQRTHGHCHAPSIRSEDPKLARWVEYQCRRNHRGALPDDRRLLLEDLGVEWRPPHYRSRVRDRHWELMFQALQNFHVRRGHSRVPVSYPENPALGRWSARQRHLQKLGRLAPDRGRLLEQLDLGGRPRIKSAARPPRP